MKKTGCITVLIIMAINVIIGGWSIDQILAWGGKDIPALADAFIGLIAGEISIPIAIVGYILKHFGVF